VILGEPSIGRYLVGPAANSMLDIKRFFEQDSRPLTDSEFKDFWMALSKEEREEFRSADLRQVG
jgi:hypothetical protein